MRPTGTQRVRRACVVPNVLLCRSTPAWLCSASPWACRIPLRNLYEEQLNEYAERVSGLKSELYGRAGRRLSRRERSSRMLEALNDPDMQLPGAPTAGKVIERGPRQLEALTQGSEWCLTIVDIKMTSTQTPQGKTQRYSAMVIVGNLKARSDTRSPPWRARPCVLVPPLHLHIVAMRASTRSSTRRPETRMHALQGKGAYGIGASKDMNTAIFKAVRFAILGAINIPLYRGHTVYFPSQTKYVRTKISIWPRPADFGITASPIIMEACELLGIRDISVKARCPRYIALRAACRFIAMVIQDACKLWHPAHVALRSILSVCLLHRAGT